MRTHLLLAATTLLISGTAVAGRPVAPLRTQAAAPRLEVLLRAPWGTLPGEAGRVIGNESNPEGPMSFAVDAGGKLWLLDQVNGRLQVFEGGRVTRVIPIDARTAQDFVLVGDAPVLLDRLVERALIFADRNGKRLRTVPLAGAGIAEPGLITSLVREADGIWVEYDHTALVRLTLADGRPDAGRLTIPGRRVDEKQRISATFERPADAVVKWIELRARPAPSARVTFSLPVIQLVALEPQAGSGVVVGAHVFDEGPPPGYEIRSDHYEFVWLDARGAQTGRASAPAPATDDDSFRRVTTGADGRIYTLVSEPEGIAVRRVSP